LLFAFKGRYIGCAMRALHRCDVDCFAADRAGTRSGISQRQPFPNAAQGRHERARDDYSGSTEDVELSVSHETKVSHFSAGTVGNGRVHVQRQHDANGTQHQYQYPESAH
jgi:hypothetical protein